MRRHGAGDPRQKVGLTFQQIQKYERGENQLTVKRLFQFADIFHVSPLEFFPGATGQTLEGYEQLKEGFTLMRLFSQLPHAQERQAVISVARSMLHSHELDKGELCHR